MRLAVILITHTIVVFAIGAAFGWKLGESRLLKPCDGLAWWMTGDSPMALCRVKLLAN